MSSGVHRIDLKPYLRQLTCEITGGATAAAIDTKRKAEVLPRLCRQRGLGNQADPGLLTFCGGMTPPAAASGLDLRITLSRRARLARAGVSNRFFEWVTHWVPDWGDPLGLMSLVTRDLKPGVTRSLPLP